MLLTAATLAVLPASAAPPPAFTLARAGRPAATVVLARRPTPSARFAAHELVEHVRRISGATLPVVADDRPVRGPRVLVGESRATRALGLRTEAFGEQEYLVRLRPGLLVLLGRDGSPRPGTSGARREPGRAEGRFGRALALDGATTAALIPGRHDFRAFRAVDGRGTARVDFLVREETGEIFLNEINTIPGFTAISMFPKLWAASGLDAPELMNRILSEALGRKPVGTRLRDGDAEVQG